MSASPSNYDACLCLQLRQTARLVTKTYEEAMWPSGLTVPQFSLLRYLQGLKRCSQTELAEHLQLDATTLTRVLVPLERRGLITKKRTADGDGRLRVLGLTEKGAERIAEALPYWKEAQRKTRESVGAAGWSDIHALLSKLQAVLKEPQEGSTHA